MDDVLFLVHRIPYPPDKGDKIRSWRLFDYLTERYNVHLGCFIDDPEDWAHTDFLKEKCASAYFAGLNPKLKKVKSLSALLRGGPLTFSYFEDRGLAHWVEEVRKRPLAAEFVFSSAMAPYIAPKIADRPQIIDFVDADSEKWRQYADKKPFPLSWLYAREARLLGVEELKAAHSVDLSVFITREEADLVARRDGAPSQKIDWVGNGVDLDYFSPTADFARDIDAPGAPLIVFTGAMDYWANADAAAWFARDIFPLVRKRTPGAAFAIVGARPTPAVKALAKLPGVVVTGRVPDIRPYLAAADLAVAPLRIAQGIQNKVLEAMAMAKTTVATPQALFGLDTDEKFVIRSESAADAFADAVCAALGENDRRRAIGAAARAHVEAVYGWGAQFRRFDTLLEKHGLGGPPATGAQATDRKAGDADDGAALGSLSPA